MTRRALVAVSGGVDSAVALALELGSGGEVRAVTLDTSGKGPDPHAGAVAAALGVPLLVVDAAADFHRYVVLPSFGILRGGGTPNPCMLCNRELKFGLLGGMLRPGEDLVTGHYVRRSPLGVRRGLDSAKDQSYFLALVRGDDLRRCRFPLGGMEKSAVRAYALSRGIPFRRRESMDLCFDLAGGGAGAGPGPLLAPDGRVLGEHPGIEGFTVGQRRGFGALGRRLYVLSVDPGANSVTVGTERDLLSDGCTAAEGSWLDPSGPPPAGACLVQTRHRRRPVAAWLEPDGNGASFTVRFAERESAVARGQVCAVYLDDELIGGGVIRSTFTLREDRE